MLKQMLGLVALTAALWLVHLYGRVLGTSVLVVIWTMTSLLLGLGLWQRAKTRRRVWLAAYLQPNSGAFLLLRGGLLMALGQGAIALVLALYLLLAILRLNSYWQWVALLCAALALPAIAALVAHWLRTQVVSIYRAELSLRVAVGILAAVLLVFLIWQAIDAQYPDFRGATLEQALWYSVALEQARSPLLLTLLEIASATEGMHAWLAQHLLPTPGASVLQAAAWFIVLAKEPLFVWSYLQLCRGALALPQLFTRELTPLNPEATNG